MDRRGLFTALLVFGALFALCFAFAGMVIGASGEGPSPFSGNGPRIGVAEVKGIIREPRDTLEALEAFRRDDDIAAVVVRIDSPGGAVGPSQEIYRAIQRVRKKKKVVASLGAVAASGGYYIACAADRVVASAGTVTGSIGVITQLAQIDELLTLAHIRTETIKSGAMKDAGSPLRPMSPEERQYFQGVVDDVYRQFLRDVSKARGVPEADLRAVADGRVLTGEQALQHKLVDEIGSFDDAMERAVALAKKKGDPVPVYRRHDGSLWARLFQESGARVAEWLLSGLAGGAQIEMRDPHLAAP
jgi:protease IV